MNIMSRTYAAQSLLKHGPLSFLEFWMITGWDKEDCKSTLAELRAGRLIECDFKRGKYRLAKVVNK